MLPPAIPSIFLALLIIYYGMRRNRNRSGLPLPPGPRKLPIVGNLFDIPSERQWEAYSKWSKEFDSDIIHVNVAGTSIVVLSSMKAIREVFDKRSSLYSDRPRLPMLNELMGWDFGIGSRNFTHRIRKCTLMPGIFPGFMKYGDRWRAHRKMFHEAFNVGASKRFHPQQRVAAHEFLRRISHDPENVMGHLRHVNASLILNVTYGINVLSSNDPYIDLAEKAMHGLSVASIPGAFLVDTIPALKYVPSWIPGAGFQRKAKEWRKLAREVLEVPFIEAKRDVAMGTSTISFTSLSLGAFEQTGNEEYLAQETVIKATAATMYAAGSDTTLSALGTFILAMLFNPEAQKKAQAELDSVIGQGQLPDFKDEASLPYVSAIVKEVLRWKTVLPIAIPHYLSAEDEYRGYRIPTGSIVIGNAWALLHDEVGPRPFLAQCSPDLYNVRQAMYPDPHSFKPERFLLDGKINPLVMNPELVAFGFGRRVCPGRHIAYSSLWITVASILSTLNIEKAVDEEGKAVEPSYEYFQGLITTPLPFRCAITPRSPQALDVIQATVGKI
ncbi:cytochrome P450 [Mycena galericulata]|nr:cytochrome P450 [Mycena galericulata]